MALTRIEKPQWKPYFDRVSAALGARQAEAEVVGPSVGTQTQAKRIALLGVSYDNRDDVFAVIGEDLEANISHPRQINVEQELETVRSFEVVDESGDHHIFTLREPLLLPPVSH